MRCPSGHAKIKKFGFAGSGKCAQRFRCLECGKTWIEHRLMNRLKEEKVTAARSLFLSGESTRYVALQIGMHKNTAWSIKQRLCSEVGIIHCPCGKIAGHKGFCGHRLARSPARIQYLMATWKDVNSVNIYIPSRPRYERPDIPYERETELPLLVNARRALQIDQPYFDDGSGNYHEILSSSELNPLELLILKEELPEHLQKARDTEKFQLWLKAHRSWSGLVADTQVSDSGRDYKYDVLWKNK